MSDLAPARAGRQMTITDLRIHPVKSCRGISLKSSYLTHQGLKHDRKWMFVDASRKFLTIREISELTLINTSINTATGDLEITIPAREKAGLSTTLVKVPLEPTTPWLQANCEKVDVEIWSRDTDGWMYSDPSITEPIAKFFKSINPDTEARLVMKGPSVRIAVGNGAKEHLGREESVNFPDVLPVLVGSDVSLNELNTRLKERGEEAITIERFRPNIVVTGDELVPWEEDEWKLIRINPPKSILGSLSSATGIASHSIDVDVACRCARCHVPNVDPDTAVPHPKEPWTLLCTYRRVDEGMKWKPCFGMLCCPRGEGHVEVGMTVEVREVMEAAGGKGEHRFIKPF